jgi:hypothetical protein
LKEYDGSSSKIIKSISGAYKHFKGQQTLIGFHGTGTVAARNIKRDGFRDISWLKDAGVPANYFTPYIWYAHNWAHFKGQAGVIFVCMISFDNSMPKRTWDSIYKIKDRDARESTLLDKVANEKYDGIALEDEIWVWNPASVIIVGEIKIAV